MAPENELIADTKLNPTQLNAKACQTNTTAQHQQVATLVLIFISICMEKRERKTSGPTLEKLLLTYTNSATKNKILAPK